MHPTRSQLLAKLAPDLSGSADFFSFPAALSDLSSPPSCKDELAEMRLISLP